MNAYLYCRTAHNDGIALEAQVNELRRYAEQSGYSIAGIAKEYGPGTTLDRPALQEVTQAVLAGEVDAVLIYNLDRLGRGLAVTMPYIDFLTEHKVKLLVRNQPLFDCTAFLSCFA